MTTPPVRAAQLPIRRIAERVTDLAGVQPLQILPLLLPVWAVDISATIREAQPYEVFDRYLSRAIAEAGLNDARSLAGFFGVRPALIERALRFLATIGHLHRDGDTLRLTELGRRSVREGCRYVEKEDRQRLYLDGVTGSPLPRTHYSGTVWLEEPQLTLSDGTRFHQLATVTPFRADTIAHLLHRPDREEFNLPAGLITATPHEVRQAWLPAYAVECVSSLLIFVKAIDGADGYLSRVVGPRLRDVVTAEGRADAEKVWREWLDGSGFPDVRPRQLANGVLRASLPASVFPRRYKWHRLGSFEVRRRVFLQLWCEDEEIRRQAVLERAAAMARAGAARDLDELTDRVAALARQLEVAAPSVAELRPYVEDAGAATAAGGVDVGQVAGG
ncbi:hypothetical protein O7542_06185 [Micromonospora sp. WMMC264]|uniref:hypothetical protein n=1 Tax=Micromonospora TaxID=1873 RepID=UPI00248BA92D|nr:hypothetical protein [Micromonospora sp. WMMC264]WBB86722.1 hypothetical protein O7542_06185 [Micromonospora sp. WMMC264]